MIGTSFVESGGAILTVVTPLVAVPLTVITFYLRSLREHQVSRHADLVRQLDAVETSVARFQQTLSDIERDYATKEEWLRECMLARRTLDHVREKVVRLEAMVQHRGGRGWPLSGSTIIQAGGSAGRAAGADRSDAGQGD